MKETLTKKEKALLKEHQKEWLEIGLSTKPVDKEMTKNVLDSFYKKIDKKPPVYIWCDSPLSCQILIHLFKCKTSLGDSLRDSLEDSLGASLVASLEASLGASLVDSLGDSLMTSLGTSLRDSLRDSLEDSLGASLVASLGTSLRDSLRDSLGDPKIRYESTWLVGSLDSYWIAFYNFMEKIGIKYNANDSKLLTQWGDLAKSCFWIYPFKGMCFVSNRPEVIKMKDGKLHCDGGPSVKFRDGYEIHSLNGTTVSKEIAETPGEKLDPKLILNEQNVEIQREIIKKIGADIVLKKLNAKCLDKWNDPKTNCYYELLHLKVNDLDRKYMFYESASIKGYYYAQPVPPECSSALEGRSWQIRNIEREEIRQVSKTDLIKMLPETLS